MKAMLQHQHPAVQALAKQQEPSHVSMGKKQIHAKQEHQHQKFAIILTTTAITTLTTESQRAPRTAATAERRKSAALMANPQKANAPARERALQKPKKAAPEGHPASSAQQRDTGPRLNATYRRAISGLEKNA